MREMKAIARCAGALPGSGCTGWPGRSAAPPRSHTAAWWALSTTSPLLLLLSLLPTVAARTAAHPRRRAPGSVDMRAALAALYWRQGQESAAEVEYEFACTRITTGCLKYSDSDWLRRIRCARGAGRGRTAWGTQRAPSACRLAICGPASHPRHPLAWPHSQALAPGDV